MIARAIAAREDTARVVGVQFVQQIVAWDTDFYIGARRHTLERPGRSFDAILNVMIGARLRF
jgi:hypothetical protein